MTPVKVTVRNRSGRPARIRYQDFELLGGSGARYPPLPPFLAHRPELFLYSAVPIRPVYYPGFEARQFFVSPYYQVFYPSLPCWTETFPLDRGWYTATYSQWRDPLPTEEMLRRALPEGVLADGGTVTGFLYFAAVGEGERTVAFAAELADGRQGTRLAAIKIALQRK
jgi:hypothetical protein